MLPQVVQLILGSYVVLGTLIALVVLLDGFTRIDPSVRDAPRGFKALIFPGMVALWPLMAARWIRGSGRPPEENNNHRRAAAAINTQAQQ